MCKKCFDVLPKMLTGYIQKKEISHFTPTNKKTNNFHCFGEGCEYFFLPILSTIIKMIGNLSSANASHIAV